MKKTTLALVQLESKKGDVDYNLKRIAYYAQKAGDSQVDLIVFPELSTCGYDSDVFLHYQEENAISLEDERMRKLCQIAKDNRLYMVVGAMLKRNEHYTNSAVLINDEGEILHIHDKVFLWDEEKLAFSSGSTFEVIELPFAKLGMMICYDAGFPENARELAKKGAEIIVTPAAFTDSQRHRWDIYYQTRALENTCWVAGINASGEAVEEQFFGGNVLFDPDGYLFCQGADHIEEMQIAQIDVSKADWEHKMQNYLGEFFV